MLIRSPLTASQTRNRSGAFEQREAKGNELVRLRKYHHSHRGNAKGDVLLCSFWRPCTHVFRLEVLELRVDAVLRRAGRHASCGSGSPSSGADRLFTASDLRLRFLKI